MRNKQEELDELIAEAKSLIDDPPRPRDKHYSDWLYAQGKTSGASPVQTLAPPRRRKQKHSFLRGLIMILAVVAVLLLTAWFFFGEQPVSEVGLGERKIGYTTILLAGTDKDETRTDTIMLLSVDERNRRVSLISIPRDTRVSGGYDVPKLNSAYGAGGMEALMTRVTELIGYRPDGYMLVNLDGFVDLVNTMGGVKFDVPMDMNYDDPVQDLHIDLPEGEQRLSGKEAMGLVRFRSGYAAADLERVHVQRDFLTAAMRQWVTPLNLVKAPTAAAVVRRNIETDLSTANLIYIAKALAVCDRKDVVTNTMPGASRMISGGSYYVLDPSGVAELLNECCNPYEAEITPSDLNIRS